MLVVQPSIGAEGQGPPHGNTTDWRWLVIVLHHDGALIMGELLKFEYCVDIITPWLILCSYTVVRNTIDLSTADSGHSQRRQRGNNVHKVNCKAI